MPIVSNQQAIADIEWSIKSPSLINYQLANKPGELWSDATCDEFIQSLTETQNLEDWFGTSNNHRLGHYFEQLINSYLAHATNIEKAVRSIPLRDENRTLGELDFLYQTPNSEGLIHLEVAVKFYLCLSDPSDAKNWIGMDSRDNFGAKIDRLFSHQLPIAKSKKGLEILKQKGFEVERSEAFIKGRLFYPWNDFHNQQFKFPKQVNDNHLKGWWIRLADLQLLNKPNQRIFNLTKKHWLAELKSTYADEQLAELEPINLDLSFSLVQPIMVARVGSDNQEIDRGIIIPDQWPNL